jgi:hypothetical protein
MPQAMTLDWCRWVIQRDANRLMFARGWMDPVESCHYAGYMGA